MSAREQRLCPDADTAVRILDDRPREGGMSMPRATEALGGMNSTDKPSSRGRLS